MDLQIQLWNIFYLPLFVVGVITAINWMFAQPLKREKDASQHLLVSKCGFWFACFQNSPILINKTTENSEKTLKTENWRLMVCYWLWYYIRICKLMHQLCAEKFMPVNLATNKVLNLYCIVKGLVDTMWVLEHSANST